MDVGAIDGLSTLKVSHHAEHSQRGWPTSFSTGGRGGCLKVDWRFWRAACANLERLRFGLEMTLDLEGLKAMTLCSYR